MIVAEAVSKGEQTRGEGDAERNRIFADAYSRDPDFFALLSLDAGLRKGLRPATRAWSAAGLRLLPLLRGSDGRRAPGTSSAARATSGRLAPNNFARPSSPVTAMSDFLAAIGLVFVIEGVLLAAFPQPPHARIVAAIGNSPNQTHRRPRLGIGQRCYFWLVRPSNMDGTQKQHTFRSPFRPIPPPNLPAASHYLASARRASGAVWTKLSPPGEHRLHGFLLLFVRPSLTVPRGCGRCSAAAISLIARLRTAARAPGDPASLMSPRQVIDAVVNISTSQKVDSRMGNMPDLPPGSPMRGILRRILQEPARPRRPRRSGSHPAPHQFARLRLHHRSVRPHRHQQPCHRRCRRDQRHSERRHQVSRQAGRHAMQRPISRCCGSSRQAAPRR